MAEKKFNPIEKAVADALDTSFWGARHFNLERFIAICQRRGLIGSDVWSQMDLSLPLGAFEKEAKGLNEETIDDLLDTFAEVIGFDPNLVKRHFYAIRFNYADQFLADIERREKKRGKLEDLAKEAESNLESEAEEPEEEETEEESEGTETEEE